MPYYVRSLLHKQVINMKTAVYKSKILPALRRAHIASADLNRVIKNNTTNLYIIRCSNVKADARWLGFAYYYSHLALRMIPRITIAEGVDLSDLEHDGALATRIESISRVGWLAAFKDIYTKGNLVEGERLIFKSYKFCRGSGDCFGLLDLLRRYSVEVVGVPAVQVAAYLEGGRCWDGTRLTARCNIDRLFSPKAFMSIPEVSQLQFRQYLIDYVADVNPADRLPAIRDHAADLVASNGEAYKFLVDACKELLL